MVTIIHIVKRLGRVGGMESYVWHLVHGLVRQGESVAVICEIILESPAENIKVIQVNPSRERPRWKSMLCFREKVQRVIKQEFSGRKVIVHSHERSLGHQVTTFHGPPINFPSAWDVLGRLNPRLRAWRTMERDEVKCKTVEVILPVSSLIADALVARYDFTAGQSVELAWPGVDMNPLSHTSRLPQRTPVQFLFVGKEWKRKGLLTAVSVVNEFRRTRADAVLTVFGVESNQLSTDISALDWIIFEGWSAEIPWVLFDILLHPADQEPFGMVVAEARSQGLPVLMSTRVGALDLRFSNTFALSQDEPISKWCDAAQELLDLPRENEVKWTWDDLVSKHLTVIYPRVTGVRL